MPSRDTVFLSVVETGLSLRLRSPVTMAQEGGSAELTFNVRAS